MFSQIALQCACYFSISLLSWFHSGIFVVLIYLPLLKATGAILALTLTLGAICYSAIMAIASLIVAPQLAWIIFPLVWISDWFIVSRELLSIWPWPLSNDVQTCHWFAFHIFFTLLVWLAIEQPYQWYRDFIQFHNKSFNIVAILVASIIYSISAYYITLLIPYHLLRLPVY
jgi:hypothetical protein